MSTISVGCLRQRVNLEENTVFGLKELVQSLHDISGLGLCLAEKAQAIGQIHGLLMGQTFGQIDGLLDDGLGIFGGDLLNVAATLGARYDHGSLIGALKSDRKVEFSARKQTLAHHHLIAWFAIATSLFCVQAVAEHVLRNGFGLLGTLQHKLSL